MVAKFSVKVNLECRCVTDNDSFATGSVALVGCLITGNRLEKLGDNFG